MLYPMTMMVLLTFIVGLIAARTRFASVRSGDVKLRYFNLFEYRKETEMPLVDIHVIEGVFSAAEKQNMISRVTDTMVAIEGEIMRGVTWVRVHDVPSGQWGIGGKALTTDDLKAMRAGG